MEMFLSLVQHEFYMGVFSFFEQIELLQAVILISGILLLFIEMFLPGFGVAGGAGIVLLIIGIFLTARTPFEAFIMFLILFVLIAIVSAVVLRSAAKGKLAKKLILNLTSRQELGYTSSNDSTQMTGKTGISITSLRPAGTGEFDGKRMDIVTEGGYIEKGTAIKIISVNGSRIVVEPSVENP